MSLNIKIHIFLINCKLPECASDRSKTFIPLSTANIITCSACSSVIPGPNVGHVPVEYKNHMNIENH